MLKELLSPRDLAEAVGVSESTVKRWADDGHLRATRTAGGHRRIPLPEAVRFVRDARLPVVRPGALGLGDLAAESPIRPDESPEGALMQLLLGGSAADVRGLVLSLYLSGWSVGGLVDGPVRYALGRIGELWRERPSEGIFLEHRATDWCMQALLQLQRTFPVERGSRHAALGGAVAGDPYVLPSLAVGLCLHSLGYAAQNLGPDTPFAAFREALDHGHPTLVWLSASRVERRARLSEELAAFVADALDEGAQVVVGGREAHLLDLPPSPRVHRCEGLVQLEGLARGLASALPVSDTPAGTI